MTVEYYLVDEINPEPWESPTLGMGRRKGGGMYPTATSSEKQRQYQEAFRDEFKDWYPDVEPTEEPVRLSMFFWRQLAQGEMETRKVRAHRADATNLQKSTEDALQGLLFVNDNQVVQVESLIVSQDADTEPKILIVLDRAPSLSAQWVTESVYAIQEMRSTTKRTADDNVRDKGPVPF